MKKLFLLITVLLSVTASFGQKKPMNQFIDELMAKMTIDEKLGQLNLLTLAKLFLQKVNWLIISEL